MLLRSTRSQQKRNREKRPKSYKKSKRYDYRYVFESVSLRNSKAEKRETLDEYCLRNRHPGDLVAMGPMNRPHLESDSFSLPFLFDKAFDALVTSARSYRAAKPSERTDRRNVWIRNSGFHSARHMLPVRRPLSARIIPIKPLINNRPLPRTPAPLVAIAPPSSRRPAPVVEVEIVSPFDEGFPGYISSPSTKKGGRSPRRIYTAPGGKIGLSARPKYGLPTLHIV